MKTIIVLVSLILCACGGDTYVEEYDYEIDIELCEAQDGTPQLFDVMNVDTGENFIEVRCEFKKEITPPQCKPDNGLGQPCS